jgi:hypothetical protein
MKKIYLSKKIYIIFIFFLGFTLVDNPLQSQNVVLNVPEWKDYFRREQLLGRVDANISFLNLPLHFNDTIQKGVKFELMPLIFQQQYTSLHPDSKNDGLMIPATGYQAYLSAGFALRSRYYSFQFMPEAVSAENKWHAGYDGAPKFRPSYFLFYGLTMANIDAPEHFGIDPYYKVNWGQSHFLFKLGAVAAGISSENRWWGPGRYNSLLLSNTAPGFLHATIHSKKPIQTSIGSFEFQIISGYLQESGFEPFKGLSSTYTGNPYYRPRKQEKTYLNGAMLSYQPKWLPGFFLGAARTAQQYKSNIKKETGGLWLPVFAKWRNNQKTIIFNPRLLKTNLFSTIYARYVLEEENAEFYVEYARDRSTWSSWAYLMSPEFTRAYILGFQKFIPFGKSGNNAFQLGVEITQIEKSKDTRLLQGGAQSGYDWYQDLDVRQGYTHQGQFLGAGIGNGSNLYTLDIAWVKGMNKIGFKAERFAHNMDFFYWVIKDFRSAWVDMRGTLYGSIPIKKALFHFEITGIDNYNYQYYFKTKDPNNFFADGDNVFNLSARLGVSILFNKP